MAICKHCSKEIREAYPYRSATSKVWFHNSNSAFCNLDARSTRAEPDPCFDLVTNHRIAYTDMGIDTDSDDFDTHVKILKELRKITKLLKEKTRRKRK